MLGQSAYITLRSELVRRPEATRTHQVNHYYRDVAGVLAAAQVVVRLRTETRHDNQEFVRAILALKGPGETRADGATVRSEYEIDVTALVGLQANASDLPTLPESFLDEMWARSSNAFTTAGFAGPQEIRLERIGELVNSRVTAPVPDGPTLELDAYSTGADHDYFELEVESGEDDDERDEAYVGSLLGDLGIRIVTHVDYPSKFHRFLIDNTLITPSQTTIEAVESVRSRLAQ